MAAASRPLLPLEWGSDLGFVSPEEATELRGVDDYVTRLCGASGAAAVQAAVHAGDAAAAGGGLGGTTAGEVRRMYATGMGTSHPAVEAAVRLGEVDGDAALAAALAAEEAGGVYGGAGAGRGGDAGGADEQVEIDSDDEKYKGRKVGGWQLLESGWGSLSLSFAVCVGTHCNFHHSCQPALPFVPQTHKTQPQSTGRHPVARALVQGPGRPPGGR